MILTIIHIILIVLLVAAVFRLFITDYLRQKEQDEAKALKMEVSQNS